MNEDDNSIQDEYPEEIEDNYIEEQRELWEEQTGMNYPSQRKPDSLFTLFKDVWRTSNSSKVGNLDARELGDLGISVRDCQRIALLAKTLHHDDFATYFQKQGEITLATSMSKKGWFVELFITSKKEARKGNLGNLKGTPKPKWRLFGGNKQPTPNEGEQQQ